MSQSATKDPNPLLSFIKVPEPPPIDEQEVVRKAKEGQELAQDRERQRLISALAHDETLFTEGGQFVGLPTEQQRDLLAAVIDVLEAETARAIQRSRQSDYSDGIDWSDSNVRIRLSQLINAGNRGIILPDWKERISRVSEATHYYPHRYSQRVIGFELDAIMQAAAKIEQLSGEIPERITGKGLEFLPSGIGNGRKVYLNGKFRLSLADATFSHQATNGAVIAWMKSVKIDHCNIKGSQMSYEIYALSEGEDEPRRVFEDHAYDDERCFYLDPPEVEEDGTITFDYHDDGVVIKKRISP